MAKCLKYAHTCTLKVVLADQCFEIKMVLKFNLTKERDLAPSLTINDF